MKCSPCAFHLAAILLALACPLRADEPKPAAPLPAAQSKANVRVEVLMVALPQAKALELLPDLRDETKIDAACGQLLDMVKREEAKLTGYPVVVTSYPFVVVGQGRQEGESDTSLEKVYPTQFERPNSPTNFEKRNMGPELSVKCDAPLDGGNVMLGFWVTRTELQGFDAYGAEYIEQPLFLHLGDSGSLALHSGQRVLVGVHQLVKPQGQMELFILQATVLPVR